MAIGELDELGLGAYDERRTVQAFLCQHTRPISRPIMKLGVLLPCHIKPFFPLNKARAARTRELDKMENARDMSREECRRYGLKIVNSKATPKRTK